MIYLKCRPNYRLTSNLGSMHADSKKCIGVTALQLAEDSQAKVTQHADTI